MKTSDKGLELIKKHEGLKLTAYKCPAGVWTIGYGHTRTAVSGIKITEWQAEELLKSDLRIAETIVNMSLKDQLNQKQFDALVSFVFNVGAGAFQKSTLLKRIKANQEEHLIRHEFSRWDKAGGKVLAGLVRRRQDEANMYFNG
jgi:lysozyme